MKLLEASALFAFVILTVTALISIAVSDALGKTWPGFRTGNIVQAAILGLFLATLFMLIYLRLS